MIPIIDSVMKIIGKVIPDQDKQHELKIEMLKNKEKLEQHFSEYSKRDMDLRIKEMEHKGFKAMWRPTMMFSFCAIVVLYSFISYILPGIMLYFPEADIHLWGLPEPIPVDPALWDLVKYSILGIGGMRTLDKWKR